MCFSATASFVASGTLGAAGVATIAKASKKELPLACIPLLFSIQQFTDGVVWITAATSSTHIFAAYLYAFFAFVLWPVFTPLAVLLVESDVLRKRILTTFLVIGGGLSVFFINSILTTGVDVQLLRSCIAYSIPHPYGMQTVVLYVVAICGAFFVSSKRILNIFGVVLTAAFLIAGWFYLKEFSSTWCFFAAILSTILLFYFYTKKPKRI